MSDGDSLRKLADAIDRVLGGQIDVNRSDEPKSLIYAADLRRIADRLDALERRLPPREEYADERR